MIASILLPSRSRMYTKSQCLINFITSIETTVGNKNDIELLIKLDDDDNEHVRICTELAEQYSNIKYYVTPRGAGYYDIESHHNFLASKSQGTFIAISSDSCVFETPNWDGLLYEYKNKTTWFLKPEHCSAGGNLYPIMHRKLYELIGHMGHWPNDWFWDIVNMRCNIQISIPMICRRAENGIQSEASGGNPDQGTYTLNDVEVGRIISLINSERNK